MNIEGRNRPTILTILSAIYLSWGIFMGYTIYQRIFLGIPFAGIQEISGDVIAGISYSVFDLLILMVINVFMIVAGIGLLKLSKWGYYSALSLAFIGGVVSTLYFPVSIIGILVNLGIIWYLTRDKIKSLFK